MKLQGKTPYSEIRKRTKIIAIKEHTLKQKWKWARHTARTGNGPDIQQERRTIGGLNAAQNGNLGEGRDQADDQSGDGKAT